MCVIKSDRNKITPKKIHYFLNGLSSGIRDDARVLAGVNVRCGCGSKDLIDKMDFCDAYKYADWAKKKIHDFN